MLNQIRHMLYTLASILGDINAIKRGKAGKRVVRKLVTRRTAATLNKLFKD